MTVDRTRRALLGALAGAGLLGASVDPARSYLDRLAPLSGSAWDDATRSPDASVASPYGTATVQYDDYHVPGIQGDSEESLYFAVGYAQAADRLFQMDLQRRQMRGQLSTVFGDRTLDSDVFHTKMDFAGAAEASWNLVGDTRAGRMVSAFAAGVNEYVRDEPRPLEFGLLDYEPAPWSPEDTMLMAKQISWGLTGSFETLRRATIAKKLGSDALGELYPERLNHDVPIIRTTAEEPSGVRSSLSAPNPPEFADVGNPSPHGDVGKPLADWLSQFESPPGVGSNSWVVSGEHTKSGKPLLCNDPHLTLMVPPVWYEQTLRTDGVSVRGVTFPGVPFVIIGQNASGAWGFTNAGADVIDFYRYETDGDRYRYRGEWKRFDTETRTVEVSGGQSKQVTVKKTVHGPFIERENQQVAVAWTGLSATETTRAVYQYSHAGGMSEFVDATRMFDLPTQNVVYADEQGHTLYYTTGRIPIRTTDGQRVKGNRVFDGSKGEGEWSGFTPYGTSTWEGFVPFEQKPHLFDPDYVGTANQRIVDDPGFYLAESYAVPYRAERIYELLDDAVASGETLDPEFVTSMQRDVLDKHAQEVVPQLLTAADAIPDDLQSYVAELRDWDYRMQRDSKAALVFALWFQHFREETFRDEFQRAGLDAAYYPNDWVLAHLPADSKWFDDVTTDRTETRADVAARAMRKAAAEIEREGYEVYGDYNVVALTHPFDLSFLNYPKLAADGSPYTLKNFRKQETVGSSWRMVVPMAADEPSECVIPGGNSGDYFSEHYDDQLRMWVNGQYKRMDRRLTGDVAYRFGEGSN